MYFRDRPGEPMEYLQPDAVSVAAGAADTSIDLDDVFTGPWKWAGGAPKTAAAAVATVARAAATNVITITGVAAGTTTITLRADWFGGPTLVEVEVTVT